MITEISDGSRTYGSGLQAAGEGDGWYAIQGTNRLLGSEGVRHERLFLYRPGTALVIVDTVRSESPHTYTRYLHLHPNVSARPGPRGALELRAANLDAAVYDLPTDVPARRSKVRGQRQPLQGFTSPDFRQWRPRWTIAYVDTAATETRVLSIALDESRLRASGVDASHGATTIDLLDDAGAETRLDVTRDGRRLAIAGS